MWPTRLWPHTTALETSLSYIPENNKNFSSSLELSLSKADMMAAKNDEVAPLGVPICADRDQWTNSKMDAGEPISIQKVLGEAEAAGCIRNYCGSLDNGEGKNQGKVNVAVEMEAQRRRFRSFRFHQAEGPRDAYLQLREYCHAWLKPESRTKEEILDLLILEHFVAILSGEMQSWVRECEPESCAQAVAAAEDFVLILEQQVRRL
ncbi:hypothetical protein JD844_013858 [Phrynosoma platyrhinos]|uniref:SCAN box domain-containing protein n=1 Tax=Phrynosoma platyrhinos TaxID=52577 RepID=A0ABQ7TMN8_PHRPL|nr:hypothetical protein JD844_013858 [Phrynosoma platyrhinos]